LRQVPCHQTSLFYPWDEFHCGLYLSNMESREMYTLSPYNREKSFNISYTRPMSNYKIVEYTSRISSSLMRSHDRVFRVHGVEFTCTIQRAQSRILYSNVIPALAIVFFDAYIFIANLSPLYCLLTVFPLIKQIQFFSALLVNKLPYLVMVIIARTFLSVLTSLGRLLTSVLILYYPLQIKQVMQYDSYLHRSLFVLVSTAIVFLG
ncbi:hypothetical protein PENTCL1PPCAC_25551, partial [Pristionchus entomophagus]